MIKSRLSDTLGSFRRSVIDALHEIRAYFRFPMRLRVDDMARTRVVLFGLPYPGWNTTLADPKVWAAIKGVREVIRIPACRTLARWLVRGSGPAVIVPIKEVHATRLPRRCRSLAPDRDTVALLSDKGKFTAYMEGAGLSELLPRTEVNRHEIMDFPCVLKPLGYKSSFGVTVVKTPEELERMIDTWVYRTTGYLVQELVPSAVDYVSFCVSRQGRILWSVTYRMEMGAIDIRNEGNFLERKRIETPASVVRQLERALTPLGYSGICHIDYKLMADGALKIFEINPQMGRPLLSPEYTQDLSHALGSVIAHACP